MTKLTEQQRDVLVMLYINQLLRQMKLPEKYYGSTMNGNTMNSLVSKELMYGGRLTDSGLAAIDDSMKQEAEKRLEDILYRNRWHDYALANHDRLVSEIQKLTGDEKIDFFPALYSCSWQFNMGYTQYSVTARHSDSSYSVYIETTLDSESDIPELNNRVGLLMQIKALLDNELEVAKAWIAAKQA